MIQQTLLPDTEVILQVSKDYKVKTPISELLYNLKFREFLAHEDNLRAENIEIGVPNAFIFTYEGERYMCYTVNIGKKSEKSFYAIIN